MGKISFSSHSEASSKLIQIVFYSNIDILEYIMGRRGKPE